MTDKEALQDNLLKQIAQLQIEQIPIGAVKPY